MRTIGYHFTKGFLSTIYRTVPENNIAVKDTQVSKKTSRLLRISIVGAVLMLLLGATTLAIKSTMEYHRLQRIEPYALLMKAVQARAAWYAQLSGEVTQTDKIVSCYYNIPSPNNSHQLLPNQINSHLCTHINVAFARIVNKRILLEDTQIQAINEVIKLKSQNSNLKILLSVGGGGGDYGFPEMVKDHASRKLFIKSIKKILRELKLDGIDLDWEFPGIHSVGQLQANRERQHFSQLLREIRMEYIREKRPYLLTVATAAPETIVDVAYDVDQINMYVDYVNIMTYDFHTFKKYSPITGLNSPLFARPTESLFLATLNINYTVHLYLKKGLDRNKIVIGIPTYAHSFSLVNPNNNGIGSPASGFGSLGSNGFVDFPDVCHFILNYTDQVKIVTDDYAKVPYLYKDTEWVSYECPASGQAKAQYIRENGLRGAMIYSLNSDDYLGVCRSHLGLEDLFPIAQTVSRTIIGSK